MGMFEVQNPFRVHKHTHHHPIPTLMPSAGCHPPARAAWDPIQPGTEDLQGWGKHSFSGQLCQGLTLSISFCHLI